MDLTKRFRDARDIMWGIEDETRPDTLRRRPELLGALHVASRGLEDSSRQRPDDDAAPFHDDPMGGLVAVILLVIGMGIGAVLVLCAEAVWG